MTTSTTVNDNNTTTDQTITTTNGTINFNNSSGADTISSDGTGAVTVNGNNSSGNDCIDIDGASSATVNLNNSTGNDDVDIMGASGATLNATVNDNNSGTPEGVDNITITGTTVTAAVNLNNSVGDDKVTITGTTVTAAVNLNNSLGDDNVTIAATTTVNATVNLNNSGGTDIVNISGATAGANSSVTVNLNNSTGAGDRVVLEGSGTGTINALNSKGNDTLIGANTTDTINGGVGNDTVDLKGAGTINAGSGNDLGIYVLSDHYGQGGGADYYYGQGGTNTLRIVLTAEQNSDSTVTAALDAYEKLPAGATYTFNFGPNTAALTVAGWQNLDIAVVTATISGNAVEGQTLAATVTAGDETGTASFQWQELVGASWTNIYGETGATYSLKETDEGQQIRVQATYTDGLGETVTTYSAATSAVLDAAPTVTTPLLSGTAQEGATLAASASSGQPDNAVTYQWLISTDGGTTYTAIAGATAATYVVQEGDEKGLIQVVATTTNDNGVQVSKTSAATSAVLDAAPTVTTPLLSGTAQEGATLAASASSGQPDNAVTYQWLISTDGGTTYTAIAGATAATYVVQEGDEKGLIQVVATTTNDNGVQVSKTSAATSAVLDAAPTVTTPLLSGTAQEGATLAASASSGQPDNAVTYQWLISTDGGTTYTAIAGATAATYVVQEGDEKGLIQVVATTTNDNGVQVSKTSAATSAVLDAAPTVTTPLLSGTAQEGATLAASASSGQPDNAVTYQWLISTDGGTTYTAIAGATAATYVVQEGDEKGLIQVVATTTNDNGVQVSKTSAATSAVLDAAPTVTTPLLSGTAQEGATLAASASSGQPDNAVTYQWLISTDGGTTYTAIAGATAATYVVQEGDEKGLIQVVATTTNDNGVQVSKTSAATSAVLDAAPTVTTPLLSGTAQEGATLAASASSGQPDNAVTYQWLISTDGGTTYTAIAGATAATYVVQEGDEKGLIQVVATTTNDNGVQVSKTSAATSAVLDAAPTVTTPLLSGTAQEGATLAASASSGQPDNAVTYQWLISTDGGTTYTAIAGATAATYVVQEGDEKGLIQVVATTTNDNGVQVSKTSAATSAVLDAAPTVTTPLLSGTAQEGATLAASASSGQPDNAVTYQWLISTDGGTTYTAIAGATAATYVVQEGDEKGLIQVVATTTNDNGVQVSKTSAATSAVLDAAPTVTTPLLSGTAQEGATLAASASSGQPDNAVTYQWMENSGSGGTYQNISGATSPTYVLKDSDGGFQIEVVATATNGNSIQVSATSAATSAVSQVLDASNTVPGTQTATEGVNKAITGISIADPDATGNVTTTLSVLNGTLTVLAGVSGGLAVGQIVGNGTSTVVLAGSVAAINATLAAAYGLVYLEQGAHTGDTLTVATQDQGTSPLLTATSTIPINVTPAGTITITTAGKNTETVSGTFTDSVNVTSITVTDNGATITGGTPTINNINHTWSYTGFPNSEKLSPHDVLVATATDAKSNVFKSPSFTVSAPAGIAGSPINLALPGASGGQGGQISMTISGVPSGWNLNQGTNLGNGGWPVQTSDPTALTVTTPATFAGAAVLQVNESWTNADGTTGSATIADNVEAYAPGSPIFAVSGDDTLTGGSGNNEFVFGQPIGNDTVHNFNAASDALDLIGFGVSGYSALAPSIANNANGSAVVTLGSSETITLVGVDASQLSASNFVFNQEPTTNNSGAMTISDGAMLPLGGTIDNTGTIALNSTGDETDLEVLVNSVTLQGGGQVALSDNSQNVIFGGASSAILTNVDNTISGAGQIGQGQMTLANEGTIDANTTNALTIDTGSNVVSNNGVLEATGAGGLVVNSAVANSGSLIAAGGDLTLKGDVTGAGTATISGGGILEYGGASTGTTAFADATGELKLDQSANFAGAISGFTTGDSLDLADIGFGANTTLAFSENSAGTGGTLTVSDGTHTANLNLLGQYSAAGFAGAADQNGGALITYIDQTQNSPQSQNLTKPLA